MVSVASCGMASKQPTVTLICITAAKKQSVNLRLSTESFDHIGKQSTSTKDSIDFTGKAAIITPFTIMQECLAEMAEGIDDDGEHCCTIC